MGQMYDRMNDVDKSLFCLEKTAYFNNDSMDLYDLIQVCTLCYKNNKHDKLVQAIKYSR